MKFAKNNTVKITEKAIETRTTEIFIQETLFTLFPGGKPLSEIVI